MIQRLGSFVNSI